MSAQLESISPTGIIITLEVGPENPDGVDLALVDAIGRDTADTLHKIGYAIEPVYTGQRGGFLVNVLIPALSAIWAQKDVILADGSALVTILTPAVLIAKHLQNAHEKRIGKEAVQLSPIKIAFEIDGVSFSIEAPELEAVDAAIKLAERFQAQHPTLAKRVENQSNVKVKASLPKRPPRRRHK